MQPKRKIDWDSERIRTLREHLDLTQRELAAELGTRQQTISEWETGMYKPRGTSSTLLTIVAERAGFEYKADSRGKGLQNHLGLIHLYEVFCLERRCPECPLAVTPA